MENYSDHTDKNLVSQTVRTDKVFGQSLDDYFSGGFHMHARSLYLAVAQQATKYICIAAHVTRNCCSWMGTKTFIGDGIETDAVWWAL